MFRKSACHPFILIEGKGCNRHGVEKYSSQSAVNLIH